MNELQLYNTAEALDEVVVGSAEYRISCATAGNARIKTMNAMAMGDTRIQTDKATASMYCGTWDACANATDGGVQDAIQQIIGAIKKEIEA